MADPRSIGKARVEAVVAQRAGDCKRLVERLEYVAQAARALFEEMDFSFLFDRGRKLFSVGYRVDDDKLDDSYYDLLASEARLTSLIAIARGDVPVSHWFRLGRPLRLSEDGAVLVSWSGSMFEYLMPCLVTFTRQPQLAGSDLPRGGQAADRLWARARRAVGHFRVGLLGRDGALTYQYSAFGVPELAFKRGLARRPRGCAICHGTGRDVRSRTRRCATSIDLEHSGGMGAYGWYEALDYTPARRAGAELGRDGAHLHGAPPGHEPGGDRQHAARFRDAAAIPSPSAGGGRGAAAAGAPAARHRRDPRARQRGARAPPARDGAAHRPRVPWTAAALHRQRTCSATDAIR